MLTKIKKYYCLYNLFPLSILYILVWYKFHSSGNMTLRTEWWVASEQSFLPLIFTMWSQVSFTAHHSNQKHKVNLFFGSIHTSVNPCMSRLTSQIPLLCKITHFWSNFMNEDLKCRDDFVRSDWWHLGAELFTLMACFIQRAEPDDSLWVHNRP